MRTEGRPEAEMVTGGSRFSVLSSNLRIFSTRDGSVGRLCLPCTGTTGGEHLNCVFSSQRKQQCSVTSSVASPAVWVMGCWLGGGGDEALLV